MKMMENFKEKFGKHKFFKTSGENFHLLRKFGHKLETVENPDEELAKLAENLGKNLNRKNVQKYVVSFLGRNDISPTLKSVKCDALLIVGSKSSHVQAAEFMHSNMDKTRSSILKIDDVGDVLEEAPEKLANSILLFCKGLGWLTSVNLPGVQRRSSTDSQGKPTRQRSISMEDYDKPNIRRLSISQHKEWKRRRNASKEMCSSSPGFSFIKFAKDFVNGFFNIQPNPLYVLQDQFCKLISLQLISPFTLATPNFELEFYEAISEIQFRSYSELLVWRR